MGLIRDLALKLLKVRLPIFVPPSNSGSSKVGKEKAEEDTFLPDTQRVEHYKLYTHMERDPVIKPALDIYADEVATGTSMSLVTPFVINTDSKPAAQVIDIFQRTVKMSSDPYMDYIHDLCRDVAEYGDVLFEIVCNEKQVLEFVNLIPESMRYIKVQEIWKYRDGKTERKSSFRYQQQQSKGWVTFEPWQITHFKGAKSISQHWAYKSSVLWPIQDVWKLLHYSMDAMCIDRVYSSHHARVFKIDTGDLHGEEAWEHLEKLKKLYSREERTDPDTGELLLAGGLPIPEDDLWIPHGTGNQTDVKEIYGSNSRPISDIEFLLMLQCVGIGIPPQRLGILKDVRTKAVMHMVAIQFAKNVARIRLAVECGLGKALQVQLALAGLNPEEHEIWFTWPPISDERELTKMEAMKLRSEILKVLTMEANLFIPEEWLYREVLGLTDEEIRQFKDEKPDGYMSPAMFRGPSGGADMGSLEPKHWVKLLKSTEFESSLHNLRWLFDQQRSRTKHGQYTFS